MVQKKKKKKYRVNSRFYVWIISFGIVGCLSLHMILAFQNNAVPNFHGWSAEDVMEYDAKHKEINITYELVYSYDVLHNRVLSQSVKPITKYQDEPMRIHVQVSKGYPVMADFTGKSIDELLQFANTYGIKVTQYASTTPAEVEFQAPLTEDEEVNGDLLAEISPTDGALSDEETMLNDDVLSEENDNGVEGGEEVTPPTEEIESETGVVSPQESRKVVTQSIPPGSTILKGSEIEITFGLE